VVCGGPDGHLGGRQTFALRPRTDQALAAKDQGQEDQMRDRVPLVLQTVVIAALMAALVVVGSQVNALRAQEVAEGVTFDRLAETLPFPPATDPTTVSLNRITIEPHSVLDMRFLGPVILYIEQGTLNVDLEQHHLAISYSGDHADAARQRFRRGNIPQGYGVYSADGDTGPLRNNTEELVILLAVFVVPQPAGNSETLSATAVVPVATPAS
jgi:hypothetical protein